MLNSILTFYQEHRRNIAIILWVYFLLNILLYLPFFFKIGAIDRLDFKFADTSAFMRYWDGPFYVGVAKSFYNPQSSFFQVYDYPDPIYYTQHLPVFPAIVRLIAFITPIEMALLLASQIMGILGVLLLYYFFTLLVKAPEALVLSLIQLVLPLRSLVLRNVGMSETTFFFFVVLAIIMVMKKRYYWAILSASLAALTRSVGLFMFPGIFIAAFLEKKRDYKKALASFMIPLVYGGMVYWQSSMFSDFTFDQRSGGFQYILGGPPFNSIFLRDFYAGNEFYLYALVVLGFIFLYEKARKSEIYRSIFVITLSSLSFLLFSSHPDNPRYVWPFFPFAVLLPLVTFFNDKRVRLAILIMIPAILLASWSIVVENQMPLDWFAKWLRALHT